MVVPIYVKKIDEPLIARCRTCAKANRQNVSAFVLAVLERYFENTRSLYDAVAGEPSLRKIKNFGVIAGLSKGASDVATRQRRPSRRRPSR